MQIICIEGINGSGKTTQARLLAERLRREFPERSVHLFRDPGVHAGHPADQHLRPLARFNEWDNEMTRMMIYMAARCELIEAVRGLEATDDFVVLDRFAAGFYAYGAEVFSSHQDVTALLRICNSFVPDFAVVLVIDPELAQQRWGCVSGDNPDHYEKQGMERLQRLDDRYHEIMRMLPEFPYVGNTVIAANVGAGLTEAAVHEAVWWELGRLLTSAAPRE